MNCVLRNRDLHIDLGMATSFCHSPLPLLGPMPVLGHTTVPGFPWAFEPDYAAAQS